MSDTRYAVLFCGRLAPGITLEQVKQSFSELFGLTGEKLEHLFAHPKVVLKRDVPKHEAERIAHGLRRIGMEVDLHRLKQHTTIAPSTVQTVSQKASAKPIKKAPIVASELTLAADEPFVATKKEQAVAQTASTSSFSLVEEEPPLQPATEEAGAGAQAAYGGSAYNNEYVGAFDRPVVDRESLPTRLAFVFTGKGEEYFKIWIVNVFLTIVTLGIFSAWAKVRTKRYFYGNTFIDNASFEYLADPIKILKGRLIAAAFFIVYAVSDYVSIELGLACFAILIFATPWIVMKAARFRNRNSAWRGIRFSFEGNLVGAAMSYLVWPFVAIVSLGFLSPFIVRSQTQYIIGQSRFGGEDFANSATISEPRFKYEAQRG